MIDSSQWRLLRYYQPRDFRYPDKLTFSVVHALDLLTARVGLKGHVLSDWRPVSSERSKSQHPLGRAIDVTWPGLDPLTILELIRTSGLFSGFGLYRNEKGAHSFHLDTRTSRDPKTPATWGALIYRQPDLKTGVPTRVTEYTSLDRIVRFVSTKAKIGLGIGALVAVGFILWRLLRSK